MSEFNPNITQRVIAKAKAETVIVKKSFFTAHREDFVMAYSYFIGCAITLQGVWPSLDQYLPAYANKLGLGFLTFLLAADKLIRSRPRVDPQ